MDILELLFTSYYQQFKNYAAMKVNDPIVAHDIVMDAMITVDKKCDKSWTLGHLKAYLFTAIKNKCIDFVRKRKYERSINDRLDIALYDTLKEDYSKQMHSLIEELKPSYRKVLELDLKGMDSFEIATELNMKVESVHQIRSRAILELKKIKNKIRLILQ